MKIAFGYKMGVGKDESVSYLIGKYGGAKVSFSSPLYDILNYAQKRCGFSLEKDRQFLQYVGTSWARAKDPDVWIDIALSEAPQVENLYISDLRFRNEFDILRREGWILVKIQRSNLDVDARSGTGSSTHTSETELDDTDDREWNYIITNDKSLNDLHNFLDNIVLNTSYTRAPTQSV
jgi:hypothetical protein